MELWDERQTTVSAANILSENGTAKSVRMLDAVAATVILESYMAYRRNTGKS
ncbi:MAG: Holliday junction resolvase RuvX [Ruthenibacterium lactatiformans]